MDDILLPILGMMVLTFIVWMAMYWRRIRYLRAQRIHPQKLQTPEQLIELVPAAINFPANNLRNLFELPVIFYALCLYLHLAGAADPIYVMAAWLFLILRCVHSYVHCTSNHVMTRFLVYALSSLVLWLMVLRAVAERLV
jgi:hypothetical protein